MTDNYLPKIASIEQVCDWLSSKTGEEWMLSRLLECGLMPWFWLDYTPDAPPEIFGGRHEGYLAPVLFAGDTHRLECVGTDALVTMTRTHDGTLFKATPGIPVALSELRFMRADVEAEVSTKIVGAGEMARNGKVWTDEKESQLLEDLKIMSQEKAATKWGVSKARIQTIKKRAESRMNNQQGGMWNGLITASKKSTSSK